MLISSVTVDSLTGCAAAFALAGPSLDGSVLEPGQNVTMTVTFTTDKNCLTLSTANVTIASNDSFSPHHFGMAAIGGYGSLTFVSGNTSFSRNLDTSVVSETRTFVLRVVGNLDVTYQSVDVGSEWSITSGLAPGTVLTQFRDINIDVKFEPPATFEAGGPYAATLVLNTNSRHDSGKLSIPLTGRASPIPITAVAAGGQNGNVIALRRDRRVRVWGNIAGGTMAGFNRSISDATAVAMGDSFLLVLRADKTIYEWGAVTGAPTTNDVIAIAAGDNHGMALHEDGTGACAEREVDAGTV
jgi:hypothetical protein